MALWIHGCGVAASVPRTPASPGHGADCDYAAANEQAMAMDIKASGGLLGQQDHQRQCAREGSWASHERCHLDLDVRKLTELRRSGRQPLRRGCPATLLKSSLISTHKRHTTCPLAATRDRRTLTVLWSWPG